MWWNTDEVNEKAMDDIITYIKSINTKYYPLIWDIETKIKEYEEGKNYHREVYERWRKKSEQYAKLNK